MKSTLPILFAALTSTTAFAQQHPSEVAEDTSHEASPVQEVFFGFDSSSLPGSVPDLRPFVSWAERNPVGKIVLDGNSDPIGSNEYNIRLSARRAEAVRDKLIAMGVDGDRIVIAIYGEDGLRRTTHDLDRRVTLWTTHDPLHAIVDNALVRGKAVLWTEPVTYAELHPSADQVATR